MYVINNWFVLFRQSEDTVITERQDNIFLVGINRPNSRNAVNRQTALLLRSAFEEFDKDHNLSVAVFYGVGKEPLPPKQQKQQQQQQQ